MICFSSNDVWRFPRDFVRVINFFKNKLKKVFCIRVRYKYMYMYAYPFFFFFAYQKINIRHAGTFIFSAAALGVIITITKKKIPLES